MEKNWVKVGTYTDFFVSEFVKQLLEEKGIPTVLMNKQDSSLKFGKIELFVNISDEQEAKALIAESNAKGDYEN